MSYKYKKPTTSTSTSTSTPKTKPTTSKTSKTSKTKLTKLDPTKKPDAVILPGQKFQVSATDYEIISELYESYHSITYPTTSLFDPHCTKDTASKLLVYNGTLGNFDFMVFDNKVLSVKLYYPGEYNEKTKKYENLKKKVKNDEKLIMVNLDEIDEFYEITTANKTHQKNFKLKYSQDNKTVFNTSPYPLCDNTKKWISVCYLVPYLFYSSPKFVELYTNRLFASILNNSFSDVKISEEISNLPPSSKTMGTYQQIKIEPAKTQKPATSKTAKTQKEKVNTKSFLIHSVLHPIIPRLLENDKVQADNLKNYMKKYKITEDNINECDISDVQAFYKQLNKSLYDPTDITIINQILKIKDKYPETVKIVKIDESKIKTDKKTKEITIDEEVVNEYSGIKVVEKKKRNSTEINTYTSQKHFNVQFSPIPEKATLKDICEYAIKSKKLPKEALAKLNESVKGSYEFNEEEFNILSQIALTEGFETFRLSNNTKQVKTPKTTKVIETAKLLNSNIDELNEDSEENENVGEVNLDEEEDNDNENDNNEANLDDEEDNENDEELEELSE